VSGLAPEQSSRYLSLLRELKSCCRFYDIHVHPYEVLFDRFSYESDASISGVLSLAGKCYQGPALAPFKFPEAAFFNEEQPDSQRLQDISLMLLRKVYGSVGAPVFVDHMNLSAMDGVLLLPVAPAWCDPVQFEGRMRWVRELYQDRDRFWIAGCIPATLEGEEIGAYAATLKERYGIRAMKCHPVVSGIDLGAAAGKGWLEQMLVACGALGLPLLLHGGRNNPYWGGSRGDFGSIWHLREIDFSLSRHPVILAHAGLHRCSAQEISEQGLSILTKMLNRHAQLYVDISGLGFEQLKLVLQSVDRERILFGSDALYVPQWEAVTMTMHAIQDLGLALEESFIQLASSNPSRIVFKDQEP
jgi:predicted TIM-barrel fold metal-dependent hydrolase